VTPPSFLGRGSSSSLPSIVRFRGTTRRRRGEEFPPPLFPFSSCLFSLAGRGHGAAPFSGVFFQFFPFPAAMEEIESLPPCTDPQQGLYQASFFLPSPPLLGNQESSGLSFSSGARFSSWHPTALHRYPFSRGQRCEKSGAFQPLLFFLFLPCERIE